MMPLRKMINPEDIAAHNRKEYGRPWKAQAGAGIPADGNWKAAVTRMLKFRELADMRAVYLDGLDLTSLPPNLPEKVKALSVNGLPVR